MDHLGLLDYEATGDLYRTCDVGVSLTVSEHPSYLPIELMACGVPVVAFDLPAGYWILHHDENALLARRTSDSLEEQISRLISDADLRERLQAGALATIASAHSSWDSNLAGVFDALSGPIGHLQRDDHAG
jgi:glycosyltransferase involved in cell wall biosynthesis